MEVKIKDWVIKRHMEGVWYLADVPHYGEVVVSKAKIQERLGLSEKELDEILEQVNSN